MPFLSLAGVDVEVATDGAVQLEGDLVGTKARMFDGTLRSTVRAIKRAWRIESPVLTTTQETTLRAAVANYATVNATGVMFNGATVSVKVTIGESGFLYESATTHRRALSLTLEEV